MTTPATVIRADARAIPLPDNSVDLIVTSPPYWSLRSYTDGGEHYDGQIGAESTPAEYITNLIGCTREWMRVLKPSGSIFCNLGDSYSSGSLPGPQGTTGQRVGRRSANEPTKAARRSDRDVPHKSLRLLPERYRITCVDQLGLIARAVVIWAKANPLPESVTDRVRRSHEDWVHLTKQPRYYSAVDSIREPHEKANFGRRSIGRAFDEKRNGDRSGVDAAHRDGHPLGKLPGSVWEIATEPLKVPDHLGVDHFAAFPTEWPRRIITAWSPPGGVVLDPFGGTGTTALVASVLGRHGISVDRSADYCRIARWRTTDPGQRAKAARVPAPPKQVDGQCDLFDMASTAESLTPVIRKEAA